MLLTQSLSVLIQLYSQEYSFCFLDVIGNRIRKRAVMTKGVARKIRLITQRDLAKALRESVYVLLTRTSTYEIGVSFDFQDIADECTVAASNLLLSE